MQGFSHQFPRQQRPGWRGLAAFQRVSVGLVLLLVLLTGGRTAAGQDLDEAAVSAERFVVVDAESGAILAERDSLVRGGMASITKIFTVLEALERAPLDMTIVARESDLFDENSTSMPGFEVGERYALEELLYGAMLESGNDAAQAIARAVGHQPGDNPDESVERFVGWMNERIKALGLEDTQLRNPHGLSEEGHYSTARDIAAFTMYALTMPAFEEIFTARRYVTSTGIEFRPISDGPLFYEDVIGGKSGYDWETGYCLVQVAEQDGERLVTVTFNGAAPSIWYEDHALLFSAGFQAVDDLDINAIGERDIVAFIAPDTNLDPFGENAPGAQTGDIAVIEPQNVEPVSLPESARPMSSSLTDDPSISGDWRLATLFAGGLVALSTIRSSGTRGIPGPGRRFDRIRTRS